MQFILPSEMGTQAPRPSDSRLWLEARNSKIMAVHTFSGSWGEEKAVETKDWILEKLGGTQYRPTEPLQWEVYRYNPPWTISMLRTNEVYRYNPPWTISMLR